MSSKSDKRPGQVYQDSNGVLYLIVQDIADEPAYLYVNHAGEVHTVVCLGEYPEALTGMNAADFFQASAAKLRKLTRLPGRDELHEQQAVEMAFVPERLDKLEAAMRAIADAVAKLR